MSYLGHVLKTVRIQSPILHTIVVVHLIAAIVCIAGLFIDDRTLFGLNVWIKPLKFAISGAIYLVTAGFLITLYPFSKRKKNIINNFNSFCLLIEGCIIMTQAARGVQSHYNISTALDGLLFICMGILIGINVLIMILFLIETVRLKLQTTKAIQLSIFMGWLIIILGSWVGGQMIGQLAHNVGVIDGGEGLPLVNWSTVGGDLRVAHFFGLHGIQFIPLFAFFLNKKWNTVVRNQLLAVSLFGFLYGSWILFTYLQAIYGIAFIG